MIPTNTIAKTAIVITAPITVFFLSSVMTGAGPAIGGGCSGCAWFGDEDASFTVRRFRSQPQQSRLDRLIQVEVR